MIQHAAEKCIDHNGYHNGYSIQFGEQWKVSSAQGMIWASIIYDTVYTALQLDQLVHLDTLGEFWTCLGSFSSSSFGWQPAECFTAFSLHLDSVTAPVS